MNKRKEFSILKWIIFPLNSVVLAGIIAYFNLRVFGLEDGAPYTAIVALIGVFSIIINRYTESDNRTLARAAFVFEICLTAALIANACYSVSVQRKMSVARMAESSQAQTIGEISKMRGSRTQREALQKVDKQESAQSVFASVEQILFWLMVAELGLYGLSSFTLFAIAKLTDDDRDPAHLADEFPTEVDATEHRAIARRPRLENPTTQTTHVSFENDDTDAQRKATREVNKPGLRRLREVLKVVGFHSKSHFKVDPKPDAGYLWIRQFKSRAGEPETIASTRARLNLLDSAARMEPEAFRSELTAFLRERGFQL